MSDQPGNTVVHFFWNNGIRYVGWLPGRTYFATRDTDQYIAIKDLLDKSNVPYWERNGYDVDSAIYGAEVHPGTFGAVASLTGGVFSQAQMLAWIDYHVNVNIPAQIQALADQRVVSSSNGEAYTISQMLSFIDAHVYVDIPAQIAALSAQVAALAKALNVKAEPAQVTTTELPAPEPAVVIKDVAVTQAPITQAVAQ